MKAHFLRTEPALRMHGGRGLRKSCRFPHRMTYYTKQDIAAFNRGIVLNYIRRHELTSRTDIWQQVGLSRAAVSLIIRGLLEDGLICEAEYGESGGGRRPCLLKILPDARYFLTFCWYSRTLSLIDLAPRVHASRPLPPLPEHPSPEAFAAALKAAETELLAVCPEAAGKLLGLGLAMPGVVDAQSGSILLSLELGWKDVPLRAILEERVAGGLPVLVQRMSNMQALGEYDGRDSADPLLLYSVYSSGVGAAVVEGGSPVSGGGHRTGEIGHTPVWIESPRYTGSLPDCPCGLRGCLESRVRLALKLRYDGWAEDLAAYSAAALTPVLNTLDPAVLMVSLDFEGSEAVFPLLCEALTAGRISCCPVLLCRTGGSVVEKGLFRLLYRTAFPES